VLNRFGGKRSLKQPGVMGTAPLDERQLDPVFSLDEKHQE